MQRNSKHALRSRLQPIIYLHIQTLKMAPPMKIFCRSAIPFLFFAFALIGCQAEPESTEPPPAPDAVPALALDAEGLRVVDPSTGSAQPLPFETAWEQAVTTVTRLRGEPGERGALEECGAGPLEYVSWGDGLTMYVSLDRFAGWRVAADTAGAYTTMAGVGIGSTRAELEEVYDISVEETTLGTEFAAGDLFGFLSGAGPDATVTELWAGVSCYFR